MNLNIIYYIQLIKYNKENNYYIEQNMNKLPGYRVRSGNENVNSGVSKDPIVANCERA